MSEDKKVFKVGDIVKQPGEYVCVPCGYRKEYRLEEKFIECTSCLSSENTTNMDEVDGTGLWEKS